MKKPNNYFQATILTLTIAALTAAPALSPQPAYAAEKISHVTITFQSEDFDETGTPIIEAVAGRDAYAVDELYTAYEYYGNDKAYDEESNIYVVELRAAEGYYFGVSKASGIRLEGVGAVFMRASRLDNGRTLIVTAELTQADSFLGEITEAWWKQTGYGEWNAAQNAHSYRISLTDPQGKSRRAETGGTTYDFRPFMQTAGDYRYRVRPLSPDGKAGNWTEGGMFTVTDAMAQDHAAQYRVETEVSYIGEERTPANRRVEYINTGWQQEADGRYWYRNEDGSYPQNTWFREGDVWYFFGGDGYMAADTYIEWGGETYYLKNDGALLTGGHAPDGRMADADGTLQQIEETPKRTR